MRTDASNAGRLAVWHAALYRIEGGKVAENSLTLLKAGSAWPDAVGQERGRASPHNQAKVRQATREIAGLQATTTMATGISRRAGSFYSN
jgi:hypothetical protein